MTSLQATLHDDAQQDSGIHWPTRFSPAEAPVHIRSELVIPAPAERIWETLLRAGDWPTFYKNAHNIHFLSHTGPTLRDRSRFRWNTFGVRITCKVQEFEPCTRLAWDAHAIGVEAWHAWLLTPLSENETHVLTEETQHGWLARLQSRFLPGRMEDQHQLWLEGLSQAAQQS